MNALRRNRMFMVMLITFCNGTVFAHEHKLKFPEDFRHASISIFEQPKRATYMMGIVRFPYDGDFLCSALGTVQVPAESWVSVEIEGQEGYERFVDALPSTGVNRLELRNATISTSLLVSLEKVESVRQLVLVNCHVIEVDANTLAGLPNLQNLSIRGRNSKEQWYGLMPWLLKCPAIQFWFGSRPMGATDLHNLSQHPAPVFLSTNLDKDAEKVLDALEKVPLLVGLELAISAEVSSAVLGRIANLRNVELVVLNEGLLNAEMVALLAQLPKLKVLRVQGSTQVGDFLSGGFPLTDIQELHLRGHWILACTSVSWTLACS
ncbi:MAG TPA: hypothetical protein DDW52_04545 [Planctomycetaceae bacterium]|nr:hypothetical protein [Planctomycetaceae bacterium]